MKIKNYERYLEEYYKDCVLRKRLSDKTVKAYKSDVKQYYDYIGKGTVDGKKINEYIHHMNDTYPKHKTVKRKIASVKAFYSYLEYEEILDYSPFHKIRTQIQEPQILPKTITMDYLEQIFELLYRNIEHAQGVYRKKIAIRNAAAIELLFATGVRISELCNLKHRDIDLDEQTIKIFGKGSKERILYIGNSSVIDVLQKYQSFQSNKISQEDYFFQNKDYKKLSEQSIRIVLNKLEKELDLRTHITPHMFRHTFATMLLDKDVDIRYIQKILGHSSISITQIYTHVSTSKQKEILSLKNPRNDIIL